MSVSSVPFPSCFWFPFRFRFVRRQVVSNCSPDTRPGSRAMGDEPLHTYARVLGNGRRVLGFPTFL